MVDVSTTCAVVGIFKAISGRDSGLKVCTGCGMAKITLGIKGLRENLGRDDGIVPLSYLWTDYLRPLLPRVSLTKWTKANEKGRHSYQLDQGMDLLERELCESHKKVPYESMIEPEESKADTITRYHHHHHHHYHRQHHHHNHFYRAYSLTWPASMLIFTNKRKFLHKKRVQFPQGCLGTPTWPPWRHVNTLYSLQISLFIKRFYVYAKFWR